MPLRPIKLPKIKKPTAAMMMHAKELSRAKAENISESKILGPGHILAQEAELAMYRHAMNLAEELWKHYNNQIIRSRKPSTRMGQARDQAEKDFKAFSQKQDTLRKYIDKKITPTKVKMPLNQKRRVGIDPADYWKYN
ncbi:MAG: hypothetical protein AABW59_00410 [archaeon]